jgi:hypothetical protein
MAYAFGDGMQMAQLQHTYACSDDVFSWIRADWKNADNDGNSVFSVGSTYEDKDCDVSGELFYGLYEEKKEVMDSVWMNMGYSPKLGDNTECTIAATFAKKVADMHVDMSHKVDKNWSVNMHSHFYGARVADKSKQNVDIGFNLSYKM